MNNNKTEELPMNWWKWWQYVIFPVGILISLGSFAQYSEIDFSMLSFWGWIIVIANFAITTLLCVTYGMFLTKKRQAFNVFITYLFLYPAWNTFVTTFNNFFSSNTANDISSNITQLFITGLISYGIICGIWIYPNYIYFKKRKDFFEKKEEKQQNINEKEDEELKNIINDIEKQNNSKIEEKIENKKYCTKCGKMIENEWTFCNFCGNKLK